MRSDIIHIDNQGAGFEQAVEETRRVAAFQGLDDKDSLRLQLCTEEILSLARIVTGEMQATFYLEAVGKSFELHLSTETVMDKTKRYQLLSSASSRKNEAANSFLGKLRDAFENAMTAEANNTCFELPTELQADLSGQTVDDREWDRYERSVLFRLADEIKIAIRGRTVDMTVVKKYA